ncbi:MAG: hypothetical protein J2P23_11735, partial [Microlunatus sp.]|nr:hypothetical protein [Microlunatus sp.]
MTSPSPTLSATTAGSAEVVAVQNEFVQVEVDRTCGRIHQIRDLLHGHDLIAEPRLAENFRLLLPLPGLRGHYLSGRDQEVAAIDRDADQQLTLRWDRLSSAHGTFDISIALRIRVDSSGDIRFRTTVDNRSSHTIEEVHNVTLGGLGVPGSQRRDWRIHYAGGGGQGREWPVFDQFPGSYLGPELPVWIGAYHGELSLPWVDVYDQVRSHGWYFGNH